MLTSVTLIVNLTIFLTALLVMANDFFLVKLLKDDGKSFFHALTEKNGDSSYDVIAFDPEDQTAFEMKITPGKLTSNVFA